LLDRIFGSCGITQYLQCDGDRHRLGYPDDLRIGGNIASPGGGDELDI